MEHHELDINKRYKNVSKTWDNEVNLKQVGNKSIENRDVFKNHHVTVDGIPILKENGYDKDPFVDFCQKIVHDEVDEYLEKHQIIEPNLDKVFDEMEDEKHSLETNDVYDWTKIIEKEIEKSSSKPDEGHTWLQKMMLGIGEDNKIQRPVMDVIEKSPHYNTEIFPETIVMMEDNFKIILTMGFCKLNAFKYRMRTGLKDINTIVEDVKKALNYEKRYKEFLTKMKNTFKQDKVLPIMIGDEPFEVKVEDTDDYNKAISHIKSYLEQYNAKKTN